MKVIVAPTDFSINSQNAVIYAADMAGALKTELSIIHVYKIPVTLTEISVQQYDAKEIISDAEDKMKKLKKRIATLTKRQITINTELMEGNVTENIEAYCNSVNTSAIVMGSEPESGFERFLFGERTIASMKKFYWPVFIIPRDSTFHGFKKIGLAYDFKEVISVPVDEIKNLVTTFNAEFHVLFVNNKSPRLFDAYISEQSGWVHQMFGELDPKYDFIKSEKVDEKITAYAEKNELDLLIIIPEKHDFLCRIFKHSHAKRIVLHTHTPIMTIHE